MATRSLTGRASPGGSVCAPGAMCSPFYRRPPSLGRMVHVFPATFSSSFRHPAPAGRRRCGPALRALEARTLLNGPSGGPIDVAADAAGNFYVVGFRSGCADLDPGPGTAWVGDTATPSDDDSFLAKYGPDKQMLWFKPFCDVPGSGTPAPSASGTWSSARTAPSTSPVRSAALRPSVIESSTRWAPRCSRPS